MFFSSETNFKTCFLLYFLHQALFCKAITDLSHYIVTCCLKLSYVTWLQVFTNAVVYLALYINKLKFVLFSDLDSNRIGCDATFKKLFFSNNVFTEL